MKTTTIYVKGLHFDVLEGELRELFSVYNPVEVSIPPGHLFGRAGRGFAFVTLEAPWVDAALRELDGTTYRGRVIHLALSRGPRQCKLAAISTRRAALDVVRRDLARLRAQPATPDCEALIAARIAQLEASIEVLDLLVSALERDDASAPATPEQA